MKLLQSIGKGGGDLGGRLAIQTICLD